MRRLLLALGTAASLAAPLLPLPLAAGPAAAAPPRGTATVCPADRLPPLPFADTTDPAVACLLGLGVTSGVTSTSYGPGVAVTRGQMAAFLSRLVRLSGAALPDDGVARFGDLGGATAEVRTAVEALADAGVVSGRTPTVFGPLEPVRRDQMASFLVRLQGFVGGPAPAPEDCFDDLPPTHAAAVGTLCALGVVQGVAPRRYDAGAPVTRRQMATFLSRLLDVDAAAGRLAGLPPVPAYAATTRVVTAADVPSSHRAGCPVPLGDLRLLEVSHWGYDGRVQTGRVVTHADAAAAVTTVFARLYDARVPVERVRLVDDYGGSDDASMAANNTSAYNCRTVAGTSTFSQHAYGRALDLNPVQNPYVARSGAVDPPAGAAWTDRRDVRPGMAVAGGPVVEAFRSVGWGWGGDFTSSKDWQHFSANGR